MATAPDWLSLDPGEEIVWAGGPRVRRILSNVVTFVGWSLAALVGAILVTRVLTVDLPVAESVVWGIVALWILIQAAGPVRAYLRTVNTEYLLTTTDLYRKTGIISENVTRVSIDKIQNTELRKDLFGNLFDYGTILVSTAGGGGVELVIEDLDDPDEFRTELRAQIAQAGDRAQTTPPPAQRGLAPQTVETLVEEARQMRETAEAIEEHLS